MIVTLSIQRIKGFFFKINMYILRLNDRVLYDKVNFTVDEGERFVFLGPNGIGKSLLLELICLGNSHELASRYKGLSVSGAILDSDGNDLLNPATRRRIAYVSQNEDFYRNKTIKEVCQTSCTGIGIDLNEERLDYLLKTFGIYDKKNQKIKSNVSFGEGKIVHIISHILKLQASSLFILDEPLNHLSFKNSKVFNDLILEEIERNSKLSIIMVSHCRAMNFTDKAMVYTTENKGIAFREYHSYDCFSNGEYAES